MSGPLTGMGRGTDVLGIRALINELESGKLRVEGS
jgi:hypothetical protein